MKNQILQPLKKPVLDPAALQGFLLQKDQQIMRMSDTIGVKDRQIMELVEDCEKLRERIADLEAQFDAGSTLGPEVVDGLDACDVVCVDDVKETPNAS